MEFKIVRTNLNKILDSIKAIKKISNAEAYIHGNRIMIFGDGDFVQYIAYEDLISSEKDLNFSFDVKELSKLLTKQPKEITIFIDENSQKLKVEDSNEIQIALLNESKYRNLEEQITFKDFMNHDEFIELLEMAYQSFQSSEFSYSDYLKLSSTHLNVYHKEFSFAASIKESFVFDYLAIHKDSLIALLKSIKKNDNIKYVDSKNLILFKNNNQYFTFRSNPHIEFPNLRDLSLLDYKEFSFETKKFKEFIKNVKTTKTIRLVFEPDNENKILHLYDNDNREIHCEISFEGELERSVFMTKYIKSLDKMIKDSDFTTIKYCLFNSKTTDEGYLWLYEPSRENYLFIPGIKEANPVPLKDKTVA